MLRLSSLCFTGILLSIAFAFPPGSRNEIPLQAKIILENADHLEVLSLDPEPHSEKSNDAFHGYTVLSRVVVTSSDTRKVLVSAFERAVEENDGRVAACFNPRHGLRASKAAKHEDFVICFECAQVKAVGDVGGSFLISGSAAPVFDGVLRQRMSRP